MEKHLARRAQLGFEALTFTASNGTILPYCSKVVNENLPGSEAVLLFLHGAGERGNDNCKQLVHGSEAVVEFLEINKIKCRVIFPQCPNDIKWVALDWDKTGHEMPQVASKPMNAVIELLKEVLNYSNVDKSRVYVSGISMGGYGSWDILLRCPNTFAAALINCGGADVSKVSALKDMPITVYHGQIDSVVPVENSRAIVKALKDAGSTLIEYHEIRKCDHNCWTPCFDDFHNWERLFSFKKN
jgi:predicted peptidase